MSYAKLLPALLVSLLPGLLGAWANYKTISTPNFEVYYRAKWETEAENVLQALEYSRPYVLKLTGNDPGKVPILLEDLGNTVNGYANPVGHCIGLFAYPPSGGELGLGEDWWQLVGVHEYIHMAQMTRAAGAPALLRSLFGNIFYPNLLQPMWMTEGITVYGESQLSPQTGRLNSGTYPAIINALAREGWLPSPAQACYYSYGNPLGNYYVYGSAFYQYLARTYGEDKFDLLYGETSSSLASYLNPIAASQTLDKAFEKTFGKGVPQLWKEWQDDVTKNSTPLPKDRITRDGWEKRGLSYHNGDLYYIQQRVDKTGPGSGFSSYSLMRVENPGTEPSQSEIINQGSDFPAGYRIVGNSVYYSRSELKPGYDNNNNDGLGAVTEIWAQGLDGRGRRKVCEGPIRAFCLLEGDILLVAEDDHSYQNSILYEIDGRSGAKTERGKLDCLIGTLDCSRGGLIVTARKFWQNNSIFALDLESLELTSLIDTPYMETVAFAGENDLVFNGTYEGRNGSYLYDLETRAVRRFAGFSEISDAALAPGGATYFISINADGCDIYRDPLKLAGFSLPASEANRAPYQRIASAKDSPILGKYAVKKASYARNISHMLVPRIYRFPLIETTDENQDGQAEELFVGVMMSGQDVVGDFPFWAASVAYDLQNMVWRYQLSLENNFFRPVKHTLQYSRQRTTELRSVQYVPFLRRMNYGLTSGEAGFGITATDDFERKIWDPFLNLSFAAKGVRFTANNTLKLETTRFWASDRDRAGWQGLFNLRWQAPFSTEFRHSVFAAYDPNADKGEVFAQLRGYTSEWGQNKGLQSSNSWYAPIFKIRNGIWSPNIYVEDINLGLFFDFAHPWDGNGESVRYSYGAELIGEIYAFYNLSLNLGVRFSQNREGDQLVYMIFGM